MDSRLHAKPRQPKSAPRRDDYTHRYTQSHHHRNPNDAYSNVDTYIDPNTNVYAKPDAIAYRHPFSHADTTLRTFSIDHPERIPALPSKCGLERRW